MAGGAQEIIAFCGTKGLGDASYPAPETSSCVRGGQLQPRIGFDKEKSREGPQRC
jgi:hypothetical protein